MVQDALGGKIDLIITKSVSRFARNTVDSLITVRKLKEKGVEIYFLKIFRVGNNDTFVGAFYLFDSFRCVQLLGVRVSLYDSF